MAMETRTQQKGQLLLMDWGVCWQPVPGARALYKGPRLEGLLSGSVGRVAELRERGAIMDFGKGGRWRVPRYFLAPPVRSGELG